MKSRTSDRNRPGSKTPSSITWSSVICGSASVSPVTVRHGLNHSRPAVSVPTRAWFPSDTTSASFMENNAGSSDLYVCNCCHAVQMVASSSAGFFSSITPSGSPFTNSTTSGLRVFLFSVTVNWLTASQSFPAGLSKSITRTRSPRTDPPVSLYSISTPFTSIR